METLYFIHNPDEIKEDQPNYDHFPFTDTLINNNTLIENEDSNWGYPAEDPTT